MKPAILGLATALPEFSEDQQVIGQKMAQLLNPSSKLARLMLGIYANCAIGRRYSVLEDIQLPIDALDFWKPPFPQVVPGTHERNRVYQKEAPILAQKAVEKLLADYGGEKKEITHIISVSCTGIMAPGIEFLLQQRLGLPDSVQRYGINMMGCFGAFKGIALASAIASQSPAHRVLVVCTELCSLHMQMTNNPEIVVGNALFSDGAGAVLVGMEPRIHENPLWDIQQSASFAIPDSLDKMSWEVTDTGFLMGLSRQVPTYILNHIADFVAKFDVPIDQWAIHPGGKNIVEAIETSCQLTRAQTAASWEVLEKCGNMSSATFLFVLEHMKKNRMGNLLGLGFGPGLSCEGVVLCAK